MIDPGPLVAGLFGGLIASAAAAWLNHKYQRQRDRDADLRAQRDARFSRLRAAYKPILLAAWGLHTAVVKSGYSAGGMTEEQRRVRIQSILAETLEGIDGYRADVLLEVGGTQVFEAFHRLWNLVDQHQALLSDVRETGVGNVELGALRLRIEALIKELEEMLSQNLARLQERVPGEDWTRTA